MGSRAATTIRIGCDGTANSMPIGAALALLSQDKTIACTLETMSSIFSRIVAGEIPSHKVWEDDRHFAFLDIAPIAPGHTLVVPKREEDYLFDLAPADYAALWHAAHTVAARLKDVLSCNRVCVMVEGYEVPHAHIHLIPTNSGPDFRGTRGETDHPALAEIAAKLAF